MKTWQKYWLTVAAIFFSAHLVRDLFQGLRIHNFLSDTLVKQDLSKTPSWYWQVFSTYLIGAVEILLAIYCFKKRRFGLPGYLTIIIAGLFITAWLFYWIFL